MNTYTKEFLISEFWRFYNENGRYPRGRELTAKIGYPSYDAYKAKWNKWNNFLEFLNLLGCDDWYKCDEQVLIDHYVDGQKEDIMNKLMVKRIWNSVIIKANKLGLYRSKEAEYGNRTMSKEFLINELHRFYKENNKIPTSLDFRNTKGYPSNKVYAINFGSWNNALQVAGYKLHLIKTHSKEYVMSVVIKYFNQYNKSPKYNELEFSHALIKNYWNSWNEMLSECGVPITTDFCKLKNKEDGILFLQEYFRTNNSIPTATEISKIESINRSWFTKKFGSWENALVESGLISDIGNFTKEQIIENSINWLKHLSNKIKRFPTVGEYDKYIKTKDSRTVVSRRNLSENLNMTYLQICDEYLDYSLLENGYGNVCFDLNNKRCKSVDEASISNLFISFGLMYEYEPPYKDVIKTEECRYKFDWVIQKEEKIIYVEYFGLYYPKDKSKLIKEYIEKAKRKIMLCEDNNLELLEIYPKDLENDFNGLLNKLKQYGIKKLEEVA